LGHRIPVEGSAVMVDSEPGYDVETLIADWQSHVGQMGAESARVRERINGQLDVAFGPAPLQKLDVFAPANAKSAPVQVYIHGGAWRGSDKAGRSYPAEVFVPAGAIWVSINYRLAPAAKLDDIVHDARAAIAWVYKNAAAIGADRDRIFVSGNSAGGHRSGMALTPGWEAEFGLPVGVVKGACAVSGVFDMRRIMRSPLNEPLKLDAATADRNSPLRHLPSPARPLIVAWGGDETDAFKRESRDYAAACRAHGSPVVEIEIPGCHHFSILPEFARRDSALVRAMFAQMGIG
jgi:arylformamidase